MITFVDILIEDLPVVEPCEPYAKKLISELCEIPEQRVLNYRRKKNDGNAIRLNEHSIIKVYAQNLAEACWGCRYTWSETVLLIHQIFNRTDYKNYNDNSVYDTHIDNIRKQYVDPVYNRMKK